MSQILHKVFLQISYSGSHFIGWARQKDNNKSIQEFLEEKFALIFKQKIIVLSCSRTDRGVHALCQSISFTYKAKNNVPINELRKILSNAIKPYIFINKIFYVKNTFNVRFDVKEKTYMYYFYKHSKKNNIFWCDKSWILNADDFCKITDNKINLWINCILGKHNFLSFINKSSDKKEQYFLKEITSIKYVINSFSIKIYITAPNFGRNMIRMLIGSLYDYSLNKCSIEDIKKYLAKPSKKYHIFKAPPEGLYLFSVKYTNNFDKIRILS